MEHCASSIDMLRCEAGGPAGRDEGESGRFWQGVLLGMLRKTPSLRVRSLLTSWLDPSEAEEGGRDSPTANAYHTTPGGRYDSALSAIATRQGKGGSFNNCGCYETPARTPKAALPTPARSDDCGISALTDRRQAVTDAKLGGAGAISPDVVDVIALANATSATGGFVSRDTISGFGKKHNASPRATRPAPQPRSVSVDSTKSTEEIDDEATGARQSGESTASTAREAVEGIDGPFALTPTAATTAAIAQGAAKGGCATAPAVSALQMCFECTNLIAGAIFMLNDRPYCCQRHRLSAYHRLERAKMAEREQRITASTHLQQSRSPQLTPSSPATVQRTCRSLPTSPAAPALSTSGLCAQYQSWI